MRIRYTMFKKCLLFTAFVVGMAFPGLAEDQSTTKPMELQVIKESIGVWDAEIEVWPEGLDAPSIKFKGVETIRPYGEYWIASDLVSEIGGETMKVHSIVGYDLDAGKMVGKVIDDGPYAARMTGDYDKDSKTVHWTTKVKTPDGTPIVQKTAITQKSADERVLVLSAPNKEKDGFIQFMRIRFSRRK